MINYRKADLADIPMLAELRKSQLMDEGQAPNINMDEELYAYFNRKMSDGTLIEWIAEIDKEIIATGSIIFMDFPPSFTNKSGRKGYIANMYTASEYRGQGIATKILGMLMKEAEIRQVDKIFLSASKMGKPVYRSFGFEEVDTYMEMSI